MKKRKMGTRLFVRSGVSLTLLLSGLVLAASSLALFAAPPSHVAAFSDWSMTGFTRRQWNILHVMSGLLFVAASLFHVIFNRKPVFNYTMPSGNRVFPFSVSFVVSVVITFYVCAGALAGLPPMGWFMNRVRSIKVAHVRSYGVPPYGGAENASLKTIANYMGWNPAGSMAALKRKGLRVKSAAQSVKEVAENNGVAVGVVVDAMRE